MKVGVVFPQTEIGNSPNAIRDYARGVEAAGYHHLAAYDHVLGHQPIDPSAWAQVGPYTNADAFHEVFVLFGFLSACTDHLELVTEVLVLPQRQTALVAKQAVEVDVLCNGRLRLGVGVGWNPIEFEVLGVNFGDRGRRIEEQIDLLRRLWRADVIDFQGKFHQIPRAGLNPLPVRRSIPLWMGGRSEAALKRAARKADGLMLTTMPPSKMADAISRIRNLLREVGRDPAGFGLEVRVAVAPSSISETVSVGRFLGGLGVTHLSIVTMDAGLTPNGHLELACRFKQAWDC